MNRGGGVERREPIFNAPAGVVWAIAVLVLIHVARLVLSEDSETWMVVALAFIPARYGGNVVDLPGAPWAAWTSPLTHALVHGDWVHLALNGAWLLIFGSLVVRRIGVFRFFLLGAIAAVAGAGVFFAFNTYRLVPMVGASGAVSGLMGAALRLMFAAADQGGMWRLREAPETIVPMTLAQALTDRRMLGVIAVLVAINAIMSLAVGSLGGSGPIAWEAHLGGFAAGLLGFGLVDRRPPPLLQGPVQ
jgi:membrane associated rhomboid family serine protease